MCVTEHVSDKHRSYCCSIRYYDGAKPDRDVAEIYRLVNSHDTPSGKASDQFFKKKLRSTQVNTGINNVW